MMKMNSALRAILLVASLSAAGLAVARSSNMIEPDARPSRRPTSR